MISPSSKFSLIAWSILSKSHLSNLFKKLYLPQASPLTHSSKTFTHWSDPIGQIQLIVLSSRIILRSSVHFEQYYWLGLFDILIILKLSDWLIFQTNSQFLKSVQIERYQSSLRKSNQTNESAPKNWQYLTSGKFTSSTILECCICL